jgi:iron complex transport system substrate-binding protein
VTLPHAARRIVLGQARHVLALSLLHPDPVSLVAGWAGDLRQMNPPDYASVRARFPAADAIPLIGRNTVETLSVEAIVAAQPDVVVLSRGGNSGDSTDLAARLNGYGVPTVVVDFFVNPMRDTARSVAILGELIGAEDRAQEFARFYEARLKRIAERVAGVADRPRVFVHAHAGGTPCCDSPGRGTFDGFVRFAGGRHLGSELLPGVHGKVAVEQLLASDPEVYVATGGPFTGRGGFPLGAGVEAAEARRELRAVLRRERLDGLTAVGTGRAHGMWHGFNDTPAHIVLIEAFARAIHPGLFADIDPAATQAELNRRFLSVPMEGAYWVDLGLGA